MDRAQFYAALRKRNFGVFGTSLSSKQVEGIEAILNEAESRKTPLTWLAYMLATAFHETAATMQPIAEYGKGKGRKYGQKGKYGQAQYGRGLVQLTWDYNYEKADKELGLRGALIHNFDLALNMKIAVKIMFEGMEHGWFTGTSLSDFLTYEPMRKIINGMDRAKLIAGYAVAFEGALRGAGYGQQVQPRPVAPEPAKPIETRPEVLLPPAPKPNTVNRLPNTVMRLVAFILSLFKRN